jgi:hypothetical protein
VADLSLTLAGGGAMQRKLEEIAQRLGSGGKVKVGFLEGATYPDGTSVATVAFFNEFGTTRAPPRPFFRRMIAAKSPGWGDRMAAAAAAVGYDSGRTLAIMGEGIKDQLVKSIVDLTSPPLKPSTVKRKGFDKPLIDTGVMQRAPAYVVESGNGAEPT